MLSATSKQCAATRASSANSAAIMLCVIACSTSAMCGGGVRKTPLPKLTVVPGRWARDPSALKRDSKGVNPAAPANVNSAAASVRKMLDASEQDHASQFGTWSTDPSLEQQLDFIANGYMYHAVPQVALDAEPLEQQLHFIEELTHELNNEEPMEQRTLAARGS